MSTITQDDDRFMPVEGLPPGVGIIRFTPATREDALTGLQHFSAWGAAIDQALNNIQGSPGKFRKNFRLQGTVDVRNPGIIIEYIASIEP